MAYKTIKVTNTNNVTEGAGVAILGKNGFNTVLGSIPLLCSAVNKVDVTGDKSIKDGNVQFTISGLSTLFDLNFNQHVLAVNDDPSVFGNLKGIDYVSIPINEKTSSGAEIDHVGYNPIVTQISIPLESYDVATNTMKVNNSVSANHPETFLIDSLPDPPFYIKVSQLLNQLYFANNSVYLEGYSTLDKKTFNAEALTVSGYCNVDINIVPRYKQAISVYIDNEEKNQSVFTWDNLSNVNVQIGTGKVLTIRTNHYTVPIIEPGDNISLFSGNVYAISETSYNPSSPSYNVLLTTNSIYRVKFATSLTANISGVTGINITSDTINQVLTAINNQKSITLQYINNNALLPLQQQLSALSVSDTSLADYNQFLADLNSALLDTNNQITQNQDIITRQKDKYNALNADFSYQLDKIGKLEKVDKIAGLNVDLLTTYQAQKGYLTKIYPACIFFLVVGLLYLSYLTYHKFIENVWSQYKD